MPDRLIDTASAADQLNCMVCQSESSVYCSKHAFGSNWIIRKCSECGHGYVSNRPTLAQLSQIYSTSNHRSSEPVTLAALKEQRDAIKVASRIAHVTDLRGRSLDVGSGDGAFSYHLALQGFTPLLIDLDERAAEGASFVPHGTFRACPFESVQDRATFDAIVMSQVLEHSLEPLAWLKHARELLSPRGVLAIALPNFGGVYRFLGARDPFLTPPIHLNFFTPGSLSLALKLCGFIEVEIASSSGVRLGPGGKPRSAFQYLARSSWNLASRVLDRTARGIILQAYAKKT